MKRTRKVGALGCAAAAAVLAAAPALAAVATSGGFVQDFNFAEALTPSGHVVSTPGPLDSGGDWFLESGSVDIVGTNLTGDGPFLAPAGSVTGTRAIDLNGNSAGTIRQTLTGLSEETQYVVTFQVSANPCINTVNAEGVATAHATINGVTVPQADGDGTFSHDATGETEGTQTWETRTFVFNTGAGETTADLRFVSDLDGACGVFLTDISAASVGAAPLLDPVVVGTSLAAAGLVGFGVWTVRRRRTAAA